MAGLSPHFGIKDRRPLASLWSRATQRLLSAVTVEKCLTGPKRGQPCDLMTDADLASQVPSVLEPRFAHKAVRVSTEAWPREARHRLHQSNASLITTVW